ncbi:hypothetical protein L0Y65_00300 [Candidatus Micrarchaeota archaeon]|nr:hypothetical protein [Candidatus Micrarchaeota archaeon]
MAKGGDYRIKKLEKGPLQRFKNQNLLIKKYGEVGLQIYKAITGKRTTRELQKDLGVEDSMFDQVLSYMQDAGMVELEPTTGKEAASAEAAATAPEETAGGEGEPEKAEEEKPSRNLEEIPPEEEVEPEGEPPPLEEKPRKKAGEDEAPGEGISPEEPPPEEEAQPGEGETLEAEAPQEEEFAFEEPREAKKKPKPAEEEISFEEIKPIEFGEEEGRPAEKTAPGRRRMGTRAGPDAESETAEEIEPVGFEPEEPEAPPPEPEPEAPPEDEGGISYEEEAPPKYPEEPELSPVEKIISDKYGDIGLQVYSLIDGQRTAEEIMRDTGLTEPKLVEILDFMDEQGIIKLDYPKGAGAGAPAQPPSGAGFGGPQAAGPAMQQAPPPGQRKEEGGFNPLTEGEESLDEARGVASPVEVPIKAPMDIVKSVQTKAKIMLKYGDKGSKLMEQLDGKNDLIDISLKLDVPLFTIYDMLRFMMESGMIIMKPMSRADVRKKYGDDGYAVYKKFGKEGLMLYELIGKELTIRQMADKITRDKAKIIDMFIFIHKVLGIELPIDRDVLSKQLGI